MAKKNVFAAREMTASVGVARRTDPNSKPKRYLAARAPIQKGASLLLGIEG